MYTFTFLVQKKIERDLFLKVQALLTVLLTGTRWTRSLCLGGCVSYLSRRKQRKADSSYRNGHPF